MSIVNSISSEIRIKEIDAIAYQVSHGDSWPEPLERQKGSNK